MQIKLLDLQAQYRSIRDEMRAAIDEVLDSQYFILGPKVAECESQIAKYIGAPYCVGVSSGSDALLASVMAAEIGPGDEVITTPFTFFATVGAIARVGAKPIFIDIDPLSYNIDPNQIEDKITSKTKAIIPVHLYGQSADMKKIVDIAHLHDLLIIEDAAQAIGAEYQGQQVGTFGDFGCFSFFPSKNLGCYGDGGMICVCNADQDEKLRRLRAHGSKPKYYHALIGGNFRLDAIQAAVVCVKLKYLDQWTASRIRHAEQYRKLFVENDLSDDVTVPWARPGDRHIYNQFVIRVAADVRDRLREYLKNNGIATEIYYPKPQHLQECFAKLNYHEGDCPEAERASLETFGIPIYPELTLEQQEYIVRFIRKFFKGV